MSVYLHVLLPQIDGRESVGAVLIEEELRRPLPRLGGLEHFPATGVASVQ